MNFRNKIHNLDTRFPTHINFMNAKSLLSREGDIINEEVSDKNDIYLYKPFTPLKTHKYPNAAKGACNKHHCLTIDGPGDGIQYLFTSVQKRNRRAPLIHPPQHCRCAVVEDKVEEISSILYKYAKDNDFEYVQNSTKTKVVLNKEDHKFSLWYLHTGLHGWQLHSNRRDPNLGQNYEDEIFDLIGFVSSFRGCGGLKICTIQTDG